MIEILDICQTNDILRAYLRNIRNHQPLKRRRKTAAKVNEDACSGCETCVGACPVSAIAMDNGKAKVNEADCIECGACVGECPCEAISL